MNREKNNENTELFSITGSDGDSGFSLNNRPKGAKSTLGLSFPRYPCFILPQLGLF